MAFEDRIKKLIIPGETFYLLKRETVPGKNEAGDPFIQWKNLQPVIGMVQEESELKDRYKGEEEVPFFMGLFFSDFDIPVGDIGEYRIKHILPTVPPQISVYQILNIDRNIRRKNRIDHYEMELGVDRKWPYVDQPEV